MGDYSDVCRGTNDDSRQPWTRTISFLGGRWMEPIALAMPDRSCSSDPCPYLTDDRRSTDAVGMGGVRIIPPWEPRDRR